MKLSIANAKGFANRLFKISEEEASFTRRHFEMTEDSKKRRLEGIGRSFVKGYNLALTTVEVSAIAQSLDLVESERRGFTYEGAAMALALTDHLWPTGRSRWQQFLEGVGSCHKYMLYVGYGWAVARLPWLRNRLPHVLARHDSLLKWLILDGYGFHEGYFHSHKTLIKHELPRQVSGYKRRAFDQGVGRSIWFFSCADVDRASKCIGEFPGVRRADLWSGVGLAATYAGGATRSELKALSERSAHFREHLAQGSAFAAKARLAAGIDVPHTSLGTQLLCGLSAYDAATVTDFALSSFDPGQYLDDTYEQWRTEVRKLLGHWLPGTLSSRVYPAPIEQPWPA